MSTVTRYAARQILSKNAHPIAELIKRTEQHLAARSLEFQISAQMCNDPRSHHIVLLTRQNFEHTLQLFVGIALRFTVSEKEIE